MRPTVLQDLIDQLESVSVVAGERQEAIDHVLAGITKLQNEAESERVKADERARKKGLAR